WARTGILATGARERWNPENANGRDQSPAHPYRAAARRAGYEQPIELPQLRHLKHVPLRTVMWPQLSQNGASPENFPSIDCCPPSAPALSARPRAPAAGFAAAGASDTR